MVAFNVMIVEPRDDRKGLMTLVLWHFGTLALARETRPVRLQGELVWVGR